MEYGKGQEQLQGLSVGGWVGGNAINQLISPWKLGGRFRSSEKWILFGAVEIQDWILEEYQVWNTYLAVTGISYKF